ncbi:transposase [Synechococcus sp. C9]|uniref:transposase n=1 Tax=Synechococcus sp. C9 TaxID=102119 RepID=UPI0030D8887D
MIIDSQAVKNTCNASIDSKGYCFYKATNGIKRHLAVDTLGFPFFTHCTPAHVSDDVGLVEMLTLNMDYFRAKPVTIPKITILLDRGYHINFLIKELEQIYPEIMTIAKHTKVDMIWVAGRSPTLVPQNLKATTLTYLAIKSALNCQRSRQNKRNQALCL